MIGGEPLLHPKYNAHVRHFNKKFGVNIPVTQDDYMDICDEKLTAEKILKQLTYPVPACKYCSRGCFDTSRVMKWHHTENTISEWI